MSIPDLCFYQHYGHVHACMSKLTASKYLVEDQNIRDQYGHETLLAKTPPSLSKDLISKIKAFVLFIGRERTL